nr:hypothetical protein [Gammaproteobacteria bacterium]
LECNGTKQHAVASQLCSKNQLEKLIFFLLFDIVATQLALSCPIAALKVLIYTYKLRAFALLLSMREQSEQLRLSLSSY